MPNTTYLAGATGKIVTMRAWVISTGLPYTAGAFNTSGLSLAYTRDGATPVAITPVTATQGTYTSSGFVHRGKGVYEIGAPTLALATGVDGVQFAADGITDVIFEVIRVELVGVDPRSAAPPAVNATQFAGQTVNAAGAVTVPTSIASPTNITAGVITTVSGNVNGSVGSVTAGVTLAASAVQAIWDAATSALTTAGSIGKWILDKLDVVLSSRGTSNYAGGDTSGTTTLLSRVTAAVPTAVQNADAFLARNQQGGSNNAPTVAAALAGGLMLITIDPTTGVMTVKNGDGTTAYTRTLTRQQLNAIITAA
jgi:hypothetical protein